MHTISLYIYDTEWYELIYSQYIQLHKAYL